MFSKLGLHRISFILLVNILPSEEDCQALQRKPFIQLATEFGYSGCFFAKCNSFLQTIPPSLKTDCPQKTKLVLLGPLWDGLCKPVVPKLHVYHAGDAWVRTRDIYFFCFNTPLDFFVNCIVVKNQTMA